MFEVGGIAGGNGGATTTEAVIEYCYNLGNITGTGEEDSGITYLGGISGNNFDKINNCYNVGNIEVKYSNGGGIAGILVDDGEISNCYNIGEIKGNNTGNIVGTANRRTKINNCYFSKEMCNLDGVGPDGNNGGMIEAIEKTVDYMKTNNFVNDLNKDKEAFTINSNLNRGFPILKWQVE